MEQNTRPSVLTPMSDAVENYVLNDMSWKVDLPAWLKEIMECSKNGPYQKSYTITAHILSILAQRAVELNDAVLNVIMMNLALYEGVHTNDGFDKVKALKQIIKDYKKRNQPKPEWKPIVGEDVYIVPRDGIDKPYTGKITKVGHKFFYVGEGWNQIKIETETMENKLNGFRPTIKCYQSIEA